MGYFMAIDPSKLGLNTFKLLIQAHSAKRIEEFEKYLILLNNVKHVARHIGLWDYEVDGVYSSMLELQEQIELLKQNFPDLIKKIEIINFGRRLITSKEIYLR